MMKLLYIFIQYTAVGIVEKGVLQPYSSVSFPAADPICLLRKGSYSLNHLHELERRDANVHTWKYRLLGFVQVFASAMTLHPDWLSFRKYLISYICFEFDCSRNKLDLITHDCIGQVRKGQALLCTASLSPRVGE